MYPSTLSATPCSTALADPFPRLQYEPPFLFILGGNDLHELEADLAHLRTRLEADLPLAELARECFAASRIRNHAYTLCLVAGTDTELRRELLRAGEGIRTEFPQDTQWITPAGSCFTWKPLYPAGKVAFVYPGATSAYAGLGRDLLRLYPDLRAYFEAYPEACAMLGTEPLENPNPTTADEHRKATEAAFLQEPVRMVEVSIVFGTLMTYALEEYFRLKPDAAFGYSLGETTMMYATRTWQNYGMSDSFRDSTLFQRQLVGEKDILRGRADYQPVSPADPWRTFLIQVDRNRLAQTVQGYPRVDICMYNTATEAIIGGDPVSCRQLIQELQCPAFELPVHHVVHTPLAQPAYAEMVELHTAQVHPPSGITMYSAAQYAPLPLDSELIGRSIAQLICQTIDFPRLVEQVYADGNRVFVELGPQSSCTGWIRSILQQRPHVAVGLDSRTMEPKTALIRALAQLRAHHVPVDLERLFPSDNRSQPSRGTSTVTEQHRHKLVQRQGYVRKQMDRMAQELDTLTARLEQPASLSKAPRPLKPASRPGVEPGYFVPVLFCAQERFSRQELESLWAGKPERCFGPMYRILARNPHLKWGTSPELWLREIEAVQTRAGHWGLGLLKAHLQPMTQPMTQPGGTIPDEAMFWQAAEQLAAFHILYLGLPAVTPQGSIECLEEQSTPLQGRENLHLLSQGGVLMLEIKHLALVPRPELRAEVRWLQQEQLLGCIPGITLAVRSPESGGGMNGHTAVEDQRPDLALNGATLQEMALGSLSKALGPAFARHDQRRSTRIPNAYFQLVSRVLEIREASQVSDNRPRLTAEYDVPAHPWYGTGACTQGLPFVILLEIALQPCGILSQWLSTNLKQPTREVFFRNLNGSGTFFHSEIRPGQTLRTEIQLNSSVQLNETLLQNYHIQVYCGDDQVFEVTTAFGLFSEEALHQNTGLDQGQPSSPAYLQSANSTRGNPGAEVRLADLRNQPEHPLYPLVQRPITLLDRLAIQTEGGHHGLGYVYGYRQVDPADWFFVCHFYQDPVMPGSLGIEAMFEALKGLALEKGLCRRFPQPRFRFTAHDPVSWKYRGQILRSTGEMHLEVHLRSIAESDERTLLQAEASLWGDAIRIYEVDNLGLEIVNLQKTVPLC